MLYGKKTLISNFTVIMYTASMMLSSAAPVLAQQFDDSLKPAPAIEQLPLEPDTQFDAVRWYDQWWNTSIKGMAGIPGNFVNDMKSTYSALKGIFKDGVKVGNVMIIRGGPDTAKIAKYHFEKMGIHYRDTIKMFPEHVVKAGEHFVDAGKHIGKVAVMNANHTADVTAYEAKRIAENAKTTVETMGDIGRWMGHSYENVAIATAKDLKSDALQTGTDVKNAVNWTGRNEELAYNDTVRWMKDYGQSDIELVKTLAHWTKQQAPDGFNDTVEWTKSAAQSTGRWTKAAAQWTGENTQAAVQVAGQNITSAARDSWNVVEDVASGFIDALHAEEKAMAKATDATVDATFGKIPGVVHDEIDATKRHAKWLWKKGYEEGLKEGFDLAGDNYFAGDIEGITVGTFYSIAAVAEGVGYVLVLEPLSFTGHVGMGVTKTVGLAAAGTVATTAVVGANVAAQVGIKAGGVAVTLGTAALAGVYDAAVAVKEGVRIAGTATIGGVATGGAAVVGGVYTAGAATAGAVRTVGGMTVGGLATAAVAGPGLVGGEAIIAGAGALRMTGTALAGTALTAGALVKGGLMMTGDVAWGAVKMVGITGVGAVGEVLVPAIDATVTSYRLAKIAGTAIVDNAVITPAIATWDILTALTLGGWEMVRDPVLGTFHLVAGATGFSYRIVGLTSALAVTAVAGTLYAIAKAPLSLVFYGGMWTIAAGGKLIDTILSPLEFDRQNRWKNERKPQLEELLGHQGRDVLDEIGEQITYIRVVFSGEDRGKVNFFTTEKNGKVFKFRRAVQDNCLVIYKSKNTTVELNSGLYDKRCVGGLEK